MKILLLEDDLDLCDLIQKELSKSGHTVDCCNDGETAMLYALNKDYGYDLALVDRMLPIIDGLTIMPSMTGSMVWTAERTIIWLSRFISGSYLPG